MNVKVGALFVAFVAIVAIMPVSIPKAEASQAADKAEVMAAFQNVMAAYNRGDATAIAAFYADDGTFFDDTIPFQLNKTMLRKSLEEFYKSTSGFHGSAESVDMASE